MSLAEVARDAPVESVIVRGGLKINYIALSADTGGAWSLFDITALTTAGPPLHTDPMNEVFYVLAGSVTFRLGKRDQDFEPGSFVQVPQGVAHAFRMPEGSRILLIHTPGGALEPYFREIGVRPGADGQLPQGAEFPSSNVIAAAAERAGVTVVGPPI